MTDTVFVNTVTVTDDNWFNDLNRLHYTIFGDPANVSTAFTAIKQPATSTIAGVLETAVQSEMETASSNALAVTPGLQQYHPAHPKAAARWSSSTTVPFAYNISTTIVKVGTGAYTLKFLNNFTSSNVVVPVFGCDDTGSLCVGSASTLSISTCTVVFRDILGNLADAANFYAAFYGDQ